MFAPRGLRAWSCRLSTALLAAAMAVPVVWPTAALAEPWGMKHIPQPPGVPRAPQPWDRDQDRGRNDDTARQRDWQEQQQREARDRNDRERHRDHERREHWNGGGWGRPGWDGRPGPWVRPAPAPVYVMPPSRRYYRPRYGAVVPVLPWAATVLVVGSATYWYCDGVYYRRLPADAGYQVVDEPPVGDGRIVDERLYVYPRSGQSAEQQASDEYECHRWAADQTQFDPTSESAWSTQDLERRDEYRRAQTACLDGRGYTVK